MLVFAVMICCPICSSTILPVNWLPRLAHHLAVADVCGLPGDVAGRCPVEEERMAERVLGFPKAHLRNLADCITSAVA